MRDPRILGARFAAAAVGLAALTPLTFALAGPPTPTKAPASASASVSASASAPASVSASAPASVSASASAPVTGAAPPQQTTAETPPKPAEEKREEAVAHWKKGTALAAKKAWDAALAEFLESRAVYPNLSATSSAAACLRNLERYDEALDMLEALLRDFAKTISPELKDAAQREMIELRGLVGTIDIEGAEPGAAMSIDQQSKGEYPLLAPIRVTIGSHVVRVYKEGFEPFEARVDIAGGKAESVKAALPKLLQSGRLHVEEQAGQTLEVLVDGGVVGKTPFEAPLPPGEHIVLLRGEGDIGTLPTPISIEQNRTATLTLAAEKLGASIKISPTPANASVAIDSLLVGRGIWQGRLRAGKHHIEVASEGFLPTVEDVVLEEGARRSLPVALQRDPSSPFWRTPPRPSRFTFDIGGYFAAGPSFAYSVAACSTNCVKSAGLGGFGAVSAGYELGSRVAFGVIGGYLYGIQTTNGASTILLPVGAPPHNGTVDDTVTLQGMLAGGWIGYSLFERFPVRVRLAAGVLAGSATDERSGTFSSRRESYSIGPVIEAHGATYFFLLPEMRVGLPVGRGFELFAGIDLPIFVVLSRAYWDPTHAVYAGSDGYGTFVQSQILTSAIFLFSPGLGARYEF